MGSKMIRQSIFFATVFCILLLFPAVAEAGNPKEAVLLPNYTYKEYDVTGNGRKDSIKIKRTKGINYNTVSVIINGKRCAAYRDKSLDGSVTAELYTLQNGKPFLFLWIVEEDLNGPVCGIFQYKSGKLKPVINCYKFGGKKNQYGTSTHCDNIKVKGNTMTVDFWMMNWTVSRMCCRYCYIYKDGTLKRQSDQASAVKVITGSVMTAEKNVKVYKNPVGKKTLYLLRKGKKIKVIGAYEKSGQFSLKIRDMSNGKIGWIRCLKKYPSQKLFKEVMYTD